MCTLSSRDDLKSCCKLKANKETFLVTALNFWRYALKRANTNGKKTTLHRCRMF